MDLRELRLGNFVYVFDNQVCEISAIGHDCWVDLLDPEEMQSTSQNPEKRQLTPIPLTEEWLIKFGFVLQTDDSDEPDNLCKTFWSIPTKDYFNFDSEFNSFIHCGMELCKVDFVHHLQNLYFCLTGEELTIKN